MSGARISQRDLRHGADDDRFALAMLRCGNASGECSFAGRCMHDGECFSSKKPGVEEVARAVKAEMHRQADMQDVPYLDTLFERDDYVKLDEFTVDFADLATAVLALFRETGGG